MNVKQIAEKAGVSIATIYKVLSKSPEISRKTVEHVENIIRENGLASPADVYMRERGKKAKAAVNGNRVVCFVILGFNLSAALPLIRGMENVLAESGVHLIVTHVPDFTRLCKFIANQHVDGLIMDGFGYPDPTPSEIKRLTKLPVVWVMEHYESWGDIVHCNNRLVGKMAAEYFLEKGYRRIGVLISEPGHRGIEKQADYFRFTLHHRNVTEQIFTIPETLLDPYSVVLPRCLDQIVAQSQRPECLFVPKDIYVAPVYNMLAARGIVPGRDIEIVTSGCNPEMLAGLSSPPLRIDINVEEIGRQAARQLLWRVSNLADRSCRYVMVPPKWASHVV